MTEHMSIQQSEDFREEDKNEKEEITYTIG